MDNEMLYGLFRREKYTAEDGYTMPYRLYIPPQYDCGEQYPLVLFLHGSGERGDDNHAQLTQGLPTLFQWEAVKNAIVVAPQCPCEQKWVSAPWSDGIYDGKEYPETRECRAVLKILDKVMAFCNIDADRVYVTGLSMGGFGTFDLLTRHGARFAAGVPICGGWDPAAAKRLTRIPIWVFHGSMDSAVPPKGSRLAYAAIRQAGGEQCRYTEYSGMDHCIWNHAYSDKDMIDWLFDQSRRERRLLAEKRARQKKKAAIVAGSVGALAIAAAIVTGKIKKQKHSNTQAADDSAPTISHTIQCTEETISGRADNTPAEATTSAKKLKPIKKIKVIKKPKSPKGKILMEKVMDRTADMTVKVIRRLIG